MAAPEQAALAAEAMAAELAQGEAAGTGTQAYAEPSLIDIILCDHRNLSTLFAHFEAAAASHKSQHVLQMHASAIIQEILLHSQAEEEVVYPLLESDASGSTDNAVLALRSREEHHQAEADVLAVLGAVGCTLGGPVVRASQVDLVTAMQKLQADLSAHMLEEEAMVLPRLAAAHSPEALILFGSNFRAAKLAVNFQAPSATLPGAQHAGAGVNVQQEGKPAGRSRADTAGMEEEQAMVMP